jgi:recombination protein RecT
MTQDAQQRLKSELHRIQPALAQILPRHLSPDRLVKIVLSATLRKPSLLECTLPSIIRSVMQAAELGLELGGLLGEAYLVPYRVTVSPNRQEKQAQCIVGYRGFIKLARQSGEISTVTAHPVYKGDVFSVDAANEEVKHLPDLFAATRDPSDIIAVYMTVRFKDGAKQIDYMNRAEIEAIRRRSKAADDGPWVSDYAEMCRKSIVRRGLKYAPISVHLARVIEDEMKIDEDGVMTDAGIVHLDDAPEQDAILGELPSPCQSRRE